MDKRLDPRLRRVVMTTDQPERLAMSSAASLVASESWRAPTVEKQIRVLVLLAAGELPPDLGHLKWTRITDTIYSTSVPLGELAALGARKEVEFVEAGRALGTSLFQAAGAARIDQLRARVPSSLGAGVVVGVIDFGLDYTLDDFRDEDGNTRVRWLWDQTLVPAPGESSPHDFPYGTEYDADAINRALKAPDPFGVVRHKPDPGAHGTHVAGIAAGNGRSTDADFPANQFIGAASQADIIFVQPASNDADTSFTDSVHVADAVAYIFRRAKDLGKPCVVNMSLGQNGGSHDGESIVERAIDRLLEVSGRAFVVAAGNEHTWRGHASGNLRAGSARTLLWMFGGGLPVPGGSVPPGLGDFTPNEMEIWYSSRDEFAVTVSDPSGHSTRQFRVGETQIQVLPSGAQVFIDSERFTVLNGDARVYIEISPPGPGQPLSAGTWAVTLEAVSVKDGHFDAWIERDARRRDNNFADQSFFVGSDFDGVRTLGTPATGRRSVAVANYDVLTDSPNSSSGRGRTRDGRTKPEIAAPGTNIWSSNALGGRPDGAGGVHPMRVSKTGTSMAAPLAAGSIALMFEQNRDLSAAQIRAMLIAGANLPPGVTVFDAAWGYGRLDAAASCDFT